MKASDLKQIEKANSVRLIDPRYAAATMASIHRSGSKRTQREVEQIMRLNCLLPQHASIINGCIVPN